MQPSICRGTTAKKEDMIKSYLVRLEEKEQTENALVNERKNSKPVEKSNRKFGRLFS